MPVPGVVVTQACGTSKTLLTYVTTSSGKPNIAELGTADMRRQAMLPGRCRVVATRQHTQSSHAQHPSKASRKIAHLCCVIGRVAYVTAWQGQHDIFHAVSPRSSFFSSDSVRL